MALGSLHGEERSTPRVAGGYVSIGHFHFSGECSNPLSVRLEALLYEQTERGNSAGGKGEIRQESIHNYIGESTTL